MATVPTTILGKIEFYEQHLPVWSVDPAAIGISATDIIDMSAVVSQARADYDTAQASRNAAKANTEVQNTSVGTMADMGGGLIDTIRAFAKKNDDPGVYAAAQIPAPQPPTPSGPPDKPTELEASVLLPFGIGLAWKGSVAVGAYFGVFRKLSSETSFSLIETTGDKKFEDITLPAGVDGVDYYIAAMRDDFKVNSVTLQVRFGAEGATVSTLTMAA
jgi:predicted dehydrogenase